VEISFFFPILPRKVKTEISFESGFRASISQIIVSKVIKQSYVLIFTATLGNFSLLHPEIFKMDLSLLCKTFFAVGTAVDVGGTLIPSFREKIMNYGSRGANTPPNAVAKAPKASIGSLFDFVTSFQVPHTWFIHYYLVSVVSSIFWAAQITTRGRVFEYFASRAGQSDSGMTVNQVVLAWSFMALQGTRRLYECITLTKPSQSKMWFGIWLLGIAYYIFMGISVWIEGIGE